MKTAVVIFTYTKDAELAEVAAAAAIRAGASVLLVWDREIPPDAEQRTPDAIHTASTFPRNGNLNGRECCLGILDIFNSVAEGVDWVVKVDSDTLISARLLERLESSRKDSEGFYVLNTATPWWGCCYALRSATVRKLSEIAQSWNFQGACPEDHTIYQMMLHNGMTRGFGEIGWVFYGPNGKVVQPKGEAIHYGDVRNIPGPPFTLAYRKSYIAKRMRDDFVGS